MERQDEKKSADLRLGIIDFCATHQGGIPLSRLYPRQLARLVYQQTGIRLRFALSHAWDLEYHERLEELLNKARLDGVLLRTSKTIFEKARLIVHSFSDGMLSSYLHPFLFRQKEFGWRKLQMTNFAHLRRLVKRKLPSLRDDIFEVPPQGFRILGFRVRDINYLLGALFKLDTWAIEDEMVMIADFTRICQENQVPFFIFGPTGYPTSFWRNRMCRKMNATAQKRLSQQGVAFAFFNDVVDQNGNPLTTGDGIHLTIHGHDFLARFFSDALCPWIKKIAMQQP